MSKQKGRAQERGLAVMSPAEPLLEVRWKPDPGSFRDEYFKFPLLGMGQFTGRQGLDIDTGRLVDFSISAQVEVYGLWHNVARVDTAHQDVHLHQLSRTGASIAITVLWPIFGPQDVDRGWVEGERLLIANWDEHVRRWRGGR